MCLFTVAAGFVEFLQSTETKRGTCTCVSPLPLSFVLSTRQGSIQALLSGLQELVYLEPLIARDGSMRPKSIDFPSFYSDWPLIGTFTLTRNRKTSHPRFSPTISLLDDLFDKNTSRPSSPPSLYLLTHACYIAPVSPLS